MVDWQQRFQDHAHAAADIRSGLRSGPPAPESILSRSPLYEADNIRGLPALSLMVSPASALDPTPGTSIGPDSNYDPPFDLR